MDPTEPKRVGRSTPFRLWWILALLLPALALAQGREITGWLEFVHLEIGGGPLRAKIDTGADHSSLDAREIEIFARDGQNWVRFGIVDSDGLVATHERPLVRTTRVKRHGLDSHDRPVVAIGICLGTKYKVTEVNLADRSRFEQPVLIGRSFLEGDFLVDPVAVFLLEPRCKQVP